MPTTLTLKNIPNDVYDKLKAAAVRHRRSLNSEAIVCLEAALIPASIGAAERLDRARRLRAQIDGEFLAREIDDFKVEGRP
ncbi:MAG: Arc family DNA-binding protein [Armatimonadetes bacterium]|nr:Arc family DNA-binding protein [Armatimonadota bacterium]